MVRIFFIQIFYTVDFIRGMTFIRKKSPKFEKLYVISSEVFFVRKSFGPTFFGSYEWGMYIYSIYHMSYIINIYHVWMLYISLYHAYITDITHIKIMRELELYILVPHTWWFRGQLIKCLVYCSTFNKGGCRGRGGMGGWLGDHHDSILNWSYMKNLVHSFFCSSKTVELVDFCKKNCTSKLYEENTKNYKNKLIIRIVYDQIGSIIFYCQCMMQKAQYYHK